MRLEYDLPCLWSTIKSNLLCIKFGLLCYPAYLLSAKMVESCSRKRTELAFPRLIADFHSRICREPVTSVEG